MGVCTFVCAYQGFIQNFFFLRGRGESGTSCVRILSSPHTLMHTLAKDYIATCTSSHWSIGRMH